MLLTINKAILVKHYDSSAMITMNNAETPLSRGVYDTYLHFQRLLSEVPQLEIHCLATEWSSLRIY